MEQRMSETIVEKQLRCVVRARSCSSEAIKATDPIERMRYVAAANVHYGMAIAYCRSLDALRDVAHYARDPTKADRELSRELDKFNKIIEEKSI